jgi:O-antigen polysaccharide polymerase Wzy
MHVNQLTLPVDVSDDVIVVLEGFACFALLGIGLVAVQLRLMSLDSAAELSVFFLGGIVLLAWRRLDRGRHPCFLFLGMLLIFQGGRLIGYVLGILDDPFRMELQTTVPFDVNRSSAEITLMLIMLSAICVYLPCRWRCRSVTLHPGWEQNWLTAAYVLLLALLPFVAYKNYRYFDYVRTHGGYLAIYTDNSAVLDSAGTLVRGLSVIAFDAFIIVFVVERRRSWLIIVTVLFLAISTLELLVGLRGKFFVFLITLWFLRNLKTNGKFRLSSLLLLGGVLSLVGVLTVGFRENTAVQSLNPIEFLTGQGISMQVTEAAVEFEANFSRYANSYLWNDLKLGFVSGPNFSQGQLLQNDLGSFLNSRASRVGFGTASSYLAEAYLWAGVIGVIVASLCISVVLRWLHSLGATPVGAVVLGLVMQSMIYLPRIGLLEPASQALKLLSGLLTTLVLIYMLHMLGRCYAIAMHYRIPLGDKLHRS